jgi:membrane protein implicated in regulation of membrane protease activity
MGIGTSLTLLAIGAILRYAITVSVHGILLPTVGLILMIIGFVGLVISLAYMFAPARTRREDFDRQATVEHRGYYG